MEPEVRAMSAFARRDGMVHTLDDELAARCRAGDADAFAEVYARCERPLYRYAYHLLGSREDADDAKQETFLRAWQSIRGFKGECSLHVWLLRICANVCRDRMKARHGKWDSRLEEGKCVDTPDSSGTDPQFSLERSFEQEALWTAIRGLPPGHRELIVLREMEELSYDEIAAALRCSIASVKVRLFRARKLLKDRLAALLDERR